MKKISEKWFSHVDITNKCHIGNCIYCSRFERHIRSDMFYEMDLDFFSKAIESYINYPNGVGIIGGEPLLHSKFKEICKIIRDLFPKEKMGLWTSINPAKSKYSDDIESTFGLIAFNEHNPLQQQACSHQPFTLSPIDMVENEVLRNDLIEDCWFDRGWCSTINPLGGYFCEVAASLAYLQGIKGVPIEPNWWQDMTKFAYQRDICNLCGACIPMEKQRLCDRKEKISKSFYNMLIDNNLPVGDFELVDKPLDFAYMKKQAATWRPGQYRDDINRNDPLGSTLDWEKYE